MFTLGGYNETVDTWAVGVMTYEILSGKLPFEEEMIIDT